MISRLAALPRDSVALGLMLAMTFSTGIVDAVGYLGLDKVFTGNMTGNVVVLGMALTGGTGLPVLGPFLALIGFMVGAALGGRLLRRSVAGWTPLMGAIFAVVGVVMLVLAVVLLVAGDHVERPLGVTVTTTLAVAMGLQAATARFLGVKDVTTVVVTSTITGLAADSVLGSGKGGGTSRRALAVALILVGALLGATLLKVHLGAGLLVAGVVTLACAAIGSLHHRHA